MVVEEAFTALTAQRPALQTAPIDAKADLGLIFSSPIYADGWMTDGGRGEAAPWLPRASTTICHSSGRPIH